MPPEGRVPQYVVGKAKKAYCRMVRFSRTGARCEEVGVGACQRVGKKYGWSNGTGGVGGCKISVKSEDYKNESGCAF
jgi:hypothetical protein